MKFTTITMQHSAKRTATFGGNGCTAIMRRVDPVTDSLNPAAIHEDSRMVMEIRPDGSKGRCQVYSLLSVVSARQFGMVGFDEVEVNVPEMIAVEQSR
jgi:hypothetical protein